MAQDRAAAEESIEGFDYDRDSDVLDVYSGDKRRAWTIELTENITVSIDRKVERAVSLTFLDFSLLARPTASGPRSFPITGLGALTGSRRALPDRPPPRPHSGWLYELEREGRT